MERNASASIYRNCNRTPLLCRADVLFLCDYHHRISSLYHNSLNKHCIDAEGSAPQGWLDIYFSSSGVLPLLRWFIVIAGVVIVLCSKACCDFGFLIFLSQRSWGKDSLLPGKRNIRLLKECLRHLICHAFQKRGIYHVISAPWRARKRGCPQSECGFFSSGCLYGGGVEFEVSLTAFMVIISRISPGSHPGHM